jgi:hypothetical protein
MVIYDFQGEWLFEDKNIDERSTIVKNIYDKSDIVLFLFPVEQIDHEAIQKPDEIPAFIRLLGKLNDDVFVSDDLKMFNNKKIAFILSKIDKLRKDYSGEDVQRDFFKENISVIERLLGEDYHNGERIGAPLNGIETCIDLITETSDDKKKTITNIILAAEQTATKEFFERVLKKEAVAIKSMASKINIDYNSIAFFSYGTPDADENIKSKNRHPIRPFNSVQWLLDNLD